MSGGGSGQAAPAGPPEGAGGRVRAGLRRMRNRGLEHLLLAAGAVLINVIALELILLAVVWEDAAVAMWRAVGVEMVAGREAAIPIALQSGVPRWLVAQVSATQDIGVFLLAYPLVLRVLGRKTRRKGWLRTRLDRIQEDADKHRGLVHRWGGFGIFVFMLVPFLVNGPLVGAIAGRLAGLRTTDILLPVVASTCIAAVAWTYFYDAVLALAGDVHPALPYVLTAIVVGGVLGSLLLRETLELRRERRKRME
jgi:uncharacterized membrane protein